ncbi:hypothetical protein [Caulobacter sp.]|uniref:hypothetical protein n=1 Tax=Caulobacter sp. TaxID=78 RepID=UPI003BB021D1
MAAALPLPADCQGIWAISLWQPWASALMFPHLKVHETRHWPAPARLIGQRVAIHAAQRRCPLNETSLLNDEAANATFGLPWRQNVPYGALIGTAILAACQPMSGQYAARPAHANDEAFGYWSAERFAWRMADPIPFETPLPMKGQQGWWRLLDSAPSGDLFGVA